MVYKWKLIINLFLDIKSLSKLVFFKNLLCEWCPEVGSNHRHKDFQCMTRDYKPYNNACFRV